MFSMIENYLPQCEKRIGHRTIRVFHCEALHCIVREEIGN